MTKRAGLTDRECRNAKPKDKPYKLSDERGLFLLVNPNGSKWWRFRYTWQGKDQLLSLGVYPAVPLAGRKLTDPERQAGKPDRIKGARELRDEARELLAAGVNPAEQKQLVRDAMAATAVSSFEAVAREWFAKFSPGWAVSHADKIIRRLERDVFPWLGRRPIGEIEPKELLAVLRRVEARGKLETAHRVHQNCGQVFRYAVATGRAQRDPSGDLRGALAPWEPQHYPSITDPKAIGELLRAMHDYKGSLVTASALKLAPLLFVRPGELRRAEWAEIDLEKGEWRIPAEKMKARALHIVPLAEQAIAILRELHPLTGTGRYVFPGVRTKREPMSENTVNAALRRMGYAKEQMTGHGFRSRASTLLNEQGWNRDAIERQLAHSEKDKVRAAYNYAEFLPERRKMMQAWADYLDVLREDRKVITGNFGRAA